MVKFGAVMTARAALLLGLFALAACGGESTPPASGETPALVAVATAEPASTGATVTAAGTVRAKRETALSFNTNGRIAAILVDGGDRVSRGQLLARLDPVAMNADDAAARAEAVRAEADLKRLSELQAKGWVPKSRVEAAQAAAGAARARVAAAGFNLRYARILAPSGGTVLKRQAETGQIVAAGTPVITIGEAREGYVLRAPLSDSDLASVKIGQPASVTMAGLGGARVEGHVSEVAGRGDERTGTFEVEIALPPVAGLRSGLIGDASIRTGAVRTGAGVTIPASAVWQARADEGFVYVVDPKTQTAKSRLVQLGDLTDRAVTITSGLNPGEMVAKSGIERIRDGGKVRFK